MDEIILSDGKKIFCNNGYIGIDDGFCVCQGYDGHVYIKGDEFINDKKDLRLNKDELLELSDIMIKRWQDFKEFISKQ
jgi:hypothetical protein